MSREIKLFLSQSLIKAPVIINSRLLHEAVQGLEKIQSWVCAPQLLLTWKEQRHTQKKSNFANVLSEIR